jgi:hypothetical protein
MCVTGCGEGRMGRVAGTSRKLRVLGSRRFVVPWSWRRLRRSHGTLRTNMSEKAVRVGGRAALCAVEFRERDLTI